MEYALVNENLVKNIIVADADFVQSIQSEWQAVIDITGLNPKPRINWIYQGGEFIAPNPPSPTPEPRHISVGAFFDRFNSEKINILASTDPVVQALVRDASVRKFIDLDRPDLVQAMQLLVSKDFNIDIDAILNAPVQPNEKA